MGLSFTCTDFRVAQKRHHIRPLFLHIFRYLENSVYTKSPQKALKNRLMHWFDAFFRLKIDPAVSNDTVDPSLLCAPISVIRDHFGFPKEQTFIQICIGRGPDVKFWLSQASPEVTPSFPQLGLKADRVVAHQRGRSKGPR